MNYCEKLKQGSATIDDVETYVEEWHDGNSSLKIYEYLGMTEDEYAVWVEQGDEYLLKFL